MATHGIAVIALAEYFLEDLLDHPACKPGLFTPITADGAPIAPVEALISAEAPLRLFQSLTADHQHVALWDSPIALNQHVNCVGFERFEIDDQSSLLCRHFLTLHLESESAAAMESVLSTLARVRNKPAQTLLQRLPLSVHPNLLLQRAFAFLHTDDDTYEDPRDPLIHVVSKSAHATPGHWTHGRLSFAAQVLAMQLSNQVLLDMLDKPGADSSTSGRRGADEYVSAVRDYLANAWWPDFSLDPATNTVVDDFYAETRLRARVAEERETMRDIWGGTEAENSRLLNRAGLILGSSAVAAAWLAFTGLGLSLSERNGIAVLGAAVTFVLVMFVTRQRK